MSCNDKASNSCMEYTYSTCIDHEAELGKNTKITSNCVNQSDVNTDLYAITDEIIENSDVSELGDLCLTYPLVDNKVILKSVLGTFEEEICTLKSKVQALEDKGLEHFDIAGMNLDLKCLVDSCGDPITELGPLLQAIIDKVCPNV